MWKACWEKEDHEKNVEEAIELLEHLENELKDKKFFGGETLGLADIAANFVAFWLRAIQEINEVEILSEKRFPRLCRWSDEFVNHDVSKLCAPPKDKLKAFFQLNYGASASN